MAMSDETPMKSDEERATEIAQKYRSQSPVLWRLALAEDALIHISEVRKQERDECARLAELAWTFDNLSPQTVNTIKLIVDAIRARSQYAQQGIANGTD